MPPPTISTFPTALITRPDPFSFRRELWQKPALCTFREEYGDRSLDPMPWCRHWCTTDSRSSSRRSSFITWTRHSRRRRSCPSHRAHARKYGFQQADRRVRPRPLHRDQLRHRFPADPWRPEPRREGGLLCQDAESEALGVQVTCSGIFGPFILGERLSVIGPRFHIASPGYLSRGPIVAAWLLRVWMECFRLRHRRILVFLIRCIRVPLL